MRKDFQEMLDIIYDDAVRTQAENYFVKYWLDKDEYFSKWLLIERSIFDPWARHLPDLMFNNGFELFPLVGGDIFVSKEDYSCLQRCMAETGDDYFVIIQNRNVVVEGFPFTRFKYPAKSTWDELMSGGIIGSEHFNNGCKDYFVFGDSAVWGRYVANSWIAPENRTGLNPVNIMGFRKEYSEIFRKNFERIRLQEPQITPEILFNEWLPDSYKEYCS